MAFKFPFSTLHELNLDWILSKVKELVDNNEEFNDKADYAVQTADEAKEIAEQAAQATIPDGAVTTVKIADGAVTGIKIADGAVTGNKIGQSTIQTGNLSSGCVTNAKILDGTISSEKMLIQTVTVPATDPDAILGDVYLSRIYKTGGSNIYSCSFSISSLTSGSGPHEIFVVPEGFRPQTTYEFMMPNQTGQVFHLYLLSSGEIRIENTSGTDISGKFCVGTISWI